MTIRNPGSFLSLVAVLVAASMLAGCGTNIARLSKQLDSPDPSVRWEAAEKLGRTGRSKAVDPLIKALADDHSGVHNAAAESLGKLGKPAVLPLSKLLKDVEPGMRTLAAFALGESTCPAAVAPLAEALEKDMAPAVRIQAAASLGNLGGETAESALAVAANKEQDNTVKEAIVKALKSLLAGRFPKK